MAKKIFVCVIVLVLLISSCLGVSAVNGKNFTPYATSNYDQNGVSSWSKQFTNGFTYGTDWNGGLVKSGGKVYLSIFVYTYKPNNYDQIWSYYILDKSEYSDRAQVPIVENAFDPLYGYEVTDLITFGSEKYLRPSKVYLVDRSDYTRFPIGIGYVENDDQLNDPQLWKHDYNYDIFISPGYSSMGGTMYEKFILEYDINEFNYNNSVSGSFGFVDNQNCFTLNPYYLVDTERDEFYSVVVPSDIIFIPNKTAKYIPRPNLQLYPYQVKISTNLFSVAQSVMDLQRSYGIQYDRLSDAEYQVRTFYAFKQTANTVACRQRFDYKVPFFNDIGTDIGMYLHTNFYFLDTATQLAYVQIDGQDLYYYNTDLGGQKIHVGYNYRINDTSTSNHMKTCNNTLFSFGVWTSYIDDYGFSIGNNANANYTDLDISQYYKEISVDFNAEEGILMGIYKFFASLFTQTLPNIINNYIVWMSLESPIISPILAPAFLMAQTAKSYVGMILIPSITAIGGFGVVMVVIFLIKRLLHFFNLTKSNGGAKS